MGNATHTKGNTPGVGVTTAEEARLNDGGLLAVGSGGLVSSRTGVLIGPGATSVVTGTSSTGTMRYSVAAHHWVTNRGTVADGPYRGAAETAKLVDTAAAPGTGSRIDIIYVKQNDAGSTLSPDATTAPVYGCVSGNSSTGTPTAPTLPVGAEELARATVLAGATRTDDGTKVTISQTAKLTTTRGGIVPIRTAAELAGLPAYPTAQALELDTGRLRWHDGTRWRYDGDHVVVTSISARNSLDGYLGLEAIVGTRRYTHTGTAWFDSLASAFMYAADPVNGWASGWWHMPLNAESIDTHGGHIIGPISGSGTNTGSELTNRYTCQPGQAGLYRVSGGIVMTVGTTSTIWCRITKNGAVFPGCAGHNNSTSVAGQVITGEKLVELAEGDYLSLQGFCSNSNWNTVVDSTNGATNWMAVERVA